MAELTIHMKLHTIQKLICLIGIFCITQGICLAQKQKLWLDADTGNEMDDLYAIARVLKDTSVTLIGLSSAHFNNPDLLVFEKWNAYDTKSLNTVRESQRLNEELLLAMGIQHIFHPLGADRQIGRAWGQSEPRNSPAASAIIDACQKLKANEKLHIITLGAMTNIASALILDPGIKSKIKLYALGAQYNPLTRVWNKNEFNIRNDLNAFDYLLNLKGLDFTIMPLEAARSLQFDRDVTLAACREHIPVEKLLADRWRIHNPQDKLRTMWDLALVEAYLKPRLATRQLVKGPPENKGGMVSVYTAIRANEMATDFWNMLKR
jgi:purine nucleosidase